MSGFDVRAGIDTGLVIVGGTLEAEDSVAGLAVNLAARLESLAQYLLRDMLANRFQIRDSDPLKVVRQTFVTSIGEFLTRDSEMKAHILGSWLGYDFGDSPYLNPVKDEPQHIMNQATLYLAQLFAAIARRGTTVVLLDDIHWADGSSLDTLLDLVRRLPDLPLLVVCLNRPSLFQRRPSWGEGVPVHTRLDLAPLSASHTCSMVAEILRMVNPITPFSGRR